MGFANDIRTEILDNRPHGAAIKLAQLGGLTFSCASIRLGRLPKLVYSTEYLRTAKHIMQLAETLYQVDITMSQRVQEHKSVPLFTVTLSGSEVGRMLNDLGILIDGEDGVRIMQTPPDYLLPDEDCSRAFIRGYFLGAGTMCDPDSGYRLELICRNAELANFLCALVASFTLDAKVAKRKSRFIVYLNEGDGVSGFMVLCGAPNSAMRFEDIRVQKDISNYINRRSNCETSNLDKQVTACARQISQIQCVLRHTASEDLPDSLREAAELRQAHPTATLSELARLAGIHKSGMNHRLKRIAQMAHDLEGFDG
ncbi:MAG TPA: DNA-binding protein WhiA [Eubacteriales bacterium]|nr:DNA-binding protein WhiA [Clostridia bacterium]HRV72654.1 DNA-binding protein WhiA [Eubacteriales bacterium]